MGESEEEAILANLDSRNETVRPAADVVLRSSAPCGDVSKDEDNLPIPDSAVFIIHETENFLVAVGSSTPVHCGVESEGSTFRESMGHAFLPHPGEIPDTSDLPLYKFLYHLIFTLL